MQMAIDVQPGDYVAEKRTPASVIFLCRGFSSWCGFVALLFTCFFSPLSVHATLVIPVPEDDLARLATAVVIGHIKEIKSYWDDEAEQAFTHVTVTPQEVLKGEIAGGDFTLKQLGGKIGRLRSWIDGSPEFRVGEKVLLFLETNPDGSACVASLYQGKFSLFTDHDTGKEFAYRGSTPERVHLLTGARTARAQTSSTANEFYEVATLKARIRDTLRTTSPREQRSSAAPLSALQVPPGSAVENHEGFVVIGFPTIRWFEPDSGAPVIMAINPTGIFPTGEEQVDAALHVWNTARQSTFRFKKGPLTSAAGFTVDGENTISFNDPGAQLPDPVNCTGILAAVSHVTISDESRTLHEQTFIRILETDLVFANGWDNCIAFKGPANVAEVATHELGHVLGLDHSPNPEATMFPFVHFDGRGATLHPDDENGVAFLYPDASFPPCTYKTSPSKRSLAGRATSGKVSVSTRSGCGWLAVSTVPWITITEGGKGSEKGKVLYTVQANSDRTARRGSILVGGKSINITQKGTAVQRERQPPPFSG